MSQTLPAIRESFEIYMSQVNKVDLLDRDEEFELAVRVHDHNDREAAQQLVLANLRFVVKVAHQYRSYGFKLEDLVQEGNVGLMQAVTRFDPHRGYRLISYAVWWIKAYIQGFIMRSWSMVKIGTTQAQKKLFFRMRRAREELRKQNDGVYDTRELAEKLEVKESQLIEMEMRLAARDFSLDLSVDEDGETTHLELLESPDPDQESLVVEAQAEQVLRADIDEALTQLDDREQYIVTHRLMADKPLTLREIGEHYGVSRERARQVEVGVKQKLKSFFLGRPAARELMPAAA